MKTKIICKRCIYDADVPNISFDAAGVCNYCHSYEQLNKEYPTGEEGQKKIEQLAQTIRQAGIGKKYDCVVGVSGGCDSSYLLYKIKELGLRPLAAHFDNTWNSTIAVENISNLLEKLKVDLFTIVVDNKEYDDLYRSFLKAGVPDIEAPTDIGLAATLYRAAEKYNIKFIIEGHSFRTEGISPLGWLYMDGKYIETIQKKFGTVPLRTFPNMSMYSFLKWTIIQRIKKIRPLYYMDYEKEPTKEFLTKNFGWKWYGGHHLENRFTAFYHSYFLPHRFKIDQRSNGFSALVRSGQMTREEGLKLYSDPPTIDPEIITLVKKRLNFSEEEFTHLMTLPLKNYKNYKTYKETFEKMRPLFWVLYKMDLVTKSFYMKYTAKHLN
jgi:N-acetyl sugar amidotransferase